MSWDEKYLRENVINRQMGRTLWVLPYHTKRSGSDDGVSRFIWDFKDGIGTAPAIAGKLLAEAVAKHERVLRDTLGCSVICCVPRSHAGPPSETAERVCSDLARQFPWLTHLRGLLHRTITIKPAHRCSPEERPTIQSHLETIAYRGGYNLDGKHVLLFDDLQTKGSTFDACTLILKSSAKCRGVAGLFLGRTTNV